jgi:pimeloyl-ACP methyl ester carboxylesterase
MHTNLPNLMRVAAVMLVKLALCIALAASATFGDTTYCWNRIFPGAYTDVVFALTTYAVPPDSDPFWCESLLGELPAALCFEHTVSEVNPPATTYFCHTGMIHGVVAPPDLYKEAEYSITYGSYSPSSPWMQHRVYLTQIDDYADEPHDTNHIVALALQETWSTTQGFVNGHLHAAKHWHVMDVPADMDVFRVDCSAGVYCVETGLTDGLRPHQPLDITVYRKQAHSDAYDGNPIAWTNAFCIYNDNGEIDATHQRVYFTLTDNHGAYVRIASATASACSYHLRLFRARPIILVHGIDSHPKTVGDNKSTMGRFARIAPWHFTMPPCRVYDFPWDSMNDNIILDPEKGLDARFAQYVYHKYLQHGDAKVALIGHSMGGYLCRVFIRKYRDPRYWDHCFLLGSPQSGSDLANATNPRYTNSMNTSYHNIRALRRGSLHAKKLHQWCNDIDDRITCVAGTDNSVRRYNKRLWIAQTFISYKRGLKHSDCVVPISSALLRNANCLTVPMNHHHIGVFTANEDRFVPRDTLTNAVYLIIQQTLTSTK